MVKIIKQDNLYIVKGESGNKLFSCYDGATALQWAINNCQAPIKIDTEIILRDNAVIKGKR